MTSASIFRRFALAYGTGFALIYVIARARGLALITVYPSLGIVLLGMHRSRDVADPAMDFLAPEMWWYGWTATATLGALVRGSSPHCSPLAGPGGFGQDGYGWLRSSQ